jgi:hypothetical protein
MVSTADAQRLRRGQAGIRVLVERDLAAFFASLNTDRPEAARDALLAFVPAQVSAYGESASAVAADWYDEQRAKARVRGRFRVPLQDSPYMDAVPGLVRRAAGGLFTAAPESTLTILTPTVGKYVLAAGRQTVSQAAVRDPAARGWARVTSGGGCEFCQMLAGRGAVYSDATAEFESHAHCNCAAVPVWG